MRQACLLAAQVLPQAAVAVCAFAALLHGNFAGPNSFFSLLPRATELNWGGITSSMYPPLRHPPFHVCLQERRWGWGWGGGQKGDRHLGDHQKKR